MAVGAEPRWRQIVKLTRTAFNIENLTAGFAVKMMVMSQARRLIASGLPWNFNGGQPTLFHERFHIPIDRRNPQSGHLAFGVFQNLLRPQGAPHAAKYVANRVSLTGFTFHPQTIRLPHSGTYRLSMKKNQQGPHHW